MTKHKWYNEIVAWAAGTEIECRLRGKQDWHVTSPVWDDLYEYRIKPQPVEPQYLYVYKDCPIFTSLKYLENYKDYYIGKIPLIVESNDDA